MRLPGRSLQKLKRSFVPRQVMVKKSIIRFMLWKKKRNKKKDAASMMRDAGHLLSSGWCCICILTNPDTRMGGWQRLAGEKHWTRYGQSSEPVNPSTCRHAVDSITPGLQNSEPTPKQRSTTSCAPPPPPPPHTLQPGQAHSTRPLSLSQSFSVMPKSSSSCHPLLK